MIERPWPVLRTYHDARRRAVSLPLGGIAVGSVGFGGRGQFRDWELENHPATGLVAEGTFLASRWTAEGQEQRCSCWRVRCSRKKWKERWGRGRRWPICGASTSACSKLLILTGGQSWTTPVLLCGLSSKPGAHSSLGTTKPAVCPWRASGSTSSRSTRPPSTPRSCSRWKTWSATVSGCPG